MIHLGFTMLTTMCLQISMLNIYNPYGCHLKGRANVQWASCLSIYYYFHILFSGTKQESGGAQKGDCPSKL